MVIIVTLMPCSARSRKVSGSSSGLPAQSWMCWCSHSTTASLLPPGWWVPGHMPKSDLPSARTVCSTRPPSAASAVATMTSATSGSATRIVQATAMTVENFQNAPATDSSRAMSNSSPTTTARARRFAATPATNAIRRHRDRLASSALVITSKSGLVAGVGWKRPTMAPGSPSDCERGHELRRAAAVVELAPVLRGGAQGGRDRAGRGAADAREPVVLGELEHEARVHDAARDTALHDQIAGVGLWRRRRGESGPCDLLAGGAWILGDSNAGRRARAAFGAAGGARTARR